MDHTFISLPEDLGSALISSHDETDTAVIYVHGFMGDAIDTWRDLVYYVDLLPDLPFAKADLYFVNYGAENEFVLTNTHFLRTFVKDLFPTPPPTLFTHCLADLDWKVCRTTELEVAIRTPKKYARLILVGHSLGGVVIRRLIADEFADLKWQSENPSSHLANADVRLFAPAQLGFRPVAWANLISSSPLGVLLRLGASLNRGFSDLQENCETLKQLRRETEHAARLHPTAKALRPYVLWGDREDIVVPGRFDTDPPLQVAVETAQSHTSVCKLTDQYHRSAYFVMLTEGPNGAA
jgi:pimeloyl-ACP methyl ester carboxylesterase